MSSVVANGTRYLKPTAYSCTLSLKLTPFHVGRNADALLDHALHAEITDLSRDPGKRHQARDADRPETEAVRVQERRALGMETF